MKTIYKIMPLVGLIGVILIFYAFRSTSQDSSLPMVSAIRQSIKVDIKAVGELEAARSISISSPIKGDQGKIIDLIADGVYVQPGQILVKMDPTPFEEKFEKLRTALREQESTIASLKQALEWEKEQADHRSLTASFEEESALLELDKILLGDGPQEMARLKVILQKALSKFEELNVYSQDLADLQAQGFLNLGEVKQAKKKMGEEQEAHEMAKQQYEGYVQHVFPMQVKKAETNLKRAQVAKEETLKTGFYTVAKSVSLLEEAKQGLNDLHLQLRVAQKELSQTEIKAPAPGMVVVREEYRSGQKRKPRVGDIAVKNQPLIDLPDLSEMVVKTRVREVDLYKVAVGKKATIELDAYPQLSFNGNILSIGVLALSDIGRISEEKYFEVRIALEGSDPRLRPGMTARALIHAQEANNVLTVPLHSVFTNERESFCSVVSSSSRCEKRLVTLGIYNEQWIEIKSGLNEGEQVSLLNPF